MFDFFMDNSIEIIIALITFLVAFLSIPIAINYILKTFNERNKTKEDKLDYIFSSVTNINEDVKEKNCNFIPPQYKPSKFYITYSSKKAALDELYEKRNTDKFLKKISFTIAVIMTIIGTIILFAGILISLFTEKEVGWITTSSGAIIELVAGVYFWLVNRTMKEVKGNSKQLEKTENLLTAIELAEKINNAKTKDEAYKNMIDKLISKNDK